jgi:hypothetical protein
VYYFIFEENITEQVEYDYLIISMDKRSHSNETFMQDISKKLNDFQNDYSLSCFVSDQKTIFLILASVINQTEEVDILDTTPI